MFLTYSDSLESTVKLKIRQVTEVSFFLPHFPRTPILIEEATVVTAVETRRPVQYGTLPRHQPTLELRFLILIKGQK